MIYGRDLLFHRKVRLWNFELFIERIMSKLIHIIIPVDSRNSLNKGNLEKAEDNHMSGIHIFEGYLEKIEAVSYTHLASRRIKFSGVTPACIAGRRTV